MAQICDKNTIPVDRIKKSNQLFKKKWFAFYFFNSNFSKPYV